MPEIVAPPSVGLLLAAGAGMRMGRPKALVVDERGPWLTRAVATLFDGGCDRVLVVLGAGAIEARALLAADPRLLGVAGQARVSDVVADDWADGLSASLRAGLAALAASAPEEARLALITLVDYPGLPSSAVARLLSPAAADVPLGPGALRRSVFHGRPGHPVVVGRSHWSALAASLTGDRGAGPYLRAHAAEPVDCSDLWDGRDVDAPA
ncbi:NTP transferase domain-containing protein [Frigoribacterium sp. PhB24]|uniref:nucleotidyltransferase family protein n=1 Tax=Frigoribacterium sp. PhB24 TaxID=2485204 RepID=UPI000F49C55D|nr:NTP transferase domain-containing protein [Frigoribacterium sp. PhB24]ROS50547.1 molybdenum cofactor cytidylyltransferase/nicotine blue oxidoreductase [Frigoribacterium sp. PhB24]